MDKTNVIKPDSRENLTTIQLTKEVKDMLSSIGTKRETFNEVIVRLISDFKSHNEKVRELLDNVNDQDANSKQIQIGENITISKYERITISIKEYVYPKEIKGLQGPSLTLEVSYNKPIKKDDNLYQIDLKIDKVIFDNEIYSPKEFFGVLQKDIVYCEEFVYFYFKSLLEVMRIEFKKSNYFFKNYHDYIELARWRTFLLNSKLSPEILSNDVESSLSDLKNERKNTQLINDVKNSYFKKIQEYSSRY